MNILMLLASAGLIIWGAVVASSDAQGALVYVFLWPICIALAAIVWGRARKCGQVKMKRAALVMIAFVLVLPFTGMAPATFELVTGETPYAFFRRRNDARGKILALAKAREGRLDLRALDLPHGWDELCVIGPYTSDEAAKTFLENNNFILSLYSQVGTNDGVAVIILREKKSINYIIEIPRNEFDFVPYSGKCVKKVDATLTLPFDRL